MGDNPKPDGADMMQKELEDIENSAILTKNSVQKLQGIMSPTPLAPPAVAPTLPSKPRSTASRLFGRGGGSPEPGGNNDAELTNTAAAEVWDVGDAPDALNLNQGGKRRKTRKIRKRKIRKRMTNKNRVFKKKSKKKKR